MLLACQNNRLESAFFGNGCPPAFSEGASEFRGSVTIDRFSPVTVRFERHGKTPRIFGDTNLNSETGSMLDFGMVLPKILASSELSIKYLSENGKNEEFFFETDGLKDIEIEVKRLCGL